MRYVILNDGETYTNLEGCAIYDSTTDKLYRVRIDKEINTHNNLDNMCWEKGILEIIDNEIDDENNSIPGK